MIKSIFTLSDCSFCDVPVPKGYPQSQTHAGVAIDKYGVVYLTTSPFPAISYSRIQVYWRSALRRLTNGVLPKELGEKYENPMIYVSADIYNESPCSFIPFRGNPLSNTPPCLFGFPSFNSDPDIYIEDEYAYILNREVLRTAPWGTPNAKPFIRICLFKFDIHSGINYISSKYIKEDFGNYTSPCLFKYRDNYHLLYLETNSYNDGGECRCYILSSETLDGKFNNPREINIVCKSFTPWHISVFNYRDITYAIVACIKKEIPGRCYQMLGVFDKELSVLNIYNKPLLSIPSYRGAAYVSPKTDNFVLYSTTVGYKDKKTKSVDGRDVVMCKRNFKSLLNELEHER